MQETWVWSLEKEVTTHSSNLYWGIPWTKEPGGLLCVWSQRVGHDWVSNTFFHFRKLSRGHGTGKGQLSFHSQIFQTTVQLCSFHILARLCSKSFKLGRLQQYINWELPDVHAGFRKGKDQIANICWTIEKAREFQKNIYFCFVDYGESLWLCGSQHTVEILKRNGTTKPPYWSEKPVCMSRSNS